jgi:gas vesicle protein
MSREPAHKERKDKLFKASKIQNFLDSIRVSLVEHGVIRRSQTLLGSTVGAIEHPNQWVTQQAQVYQQFTDTLKNKRETIKKQIKAAAKDNREFLLQQIEEIFQDTLNAIPSFAEDHWNSNEIGLKLGWEQKLKATRFEERLNNAYQETTQKFNKDVQEAIEEVGNEFKLIGKLGGGNFSFNEQDSNNFRDLVRIGGSLLLITGTILTFFAPPIGMAIGIVAGIVSMITGAFKSKDEKRREAVQNISNSLNYQVSSQKQITIQQAKGVFDDYSNSIDVNINTYFDELIQGLEVIAEQLAIAKRRLSDKANYLNRAYAKRIIDWCTEQYEPLTVESINRTIAKVKRDFGRSMNIQTKSEVKLRNSQEDINRILQEVISIQRLKYTK